MAVWVVLLEAVVDRDARTGFDEENLEALRDALADQFPVVAGTGQSYETELWVEDNMASGALLGAERLVQAAAREVGLASTEIVRAEVRNAGALEAGLIDWGSAPGQQAVEAAAPEPATKAAAKKPATKKAAAKKAAAKKAAKKTPAKQAAAKKTRRRDS